MLGGMEILSQSFSHEPSVTQSMLDSGWDCIWVAFRPRREPEPAQDRVLQYLDWKLNGLISRFLLDKGYKRKATTFVPVLQASFVPYLALEGEKHFDVQSFLRSCEGLKLKKVLLYCEDSTQSDAVASSLKNAAHPGFPECVTIGSPPH